MKPGDHVKVVCIIDPEVFGCDAWSLEEAESYVGKRGVIIRKNDDGLVGNTADDPLFVVNFHGHGRYLFWREELEVA